MDFLKEFNKIMENTNNIALATAVDNIPNVRMVNFYYNPQNKGVLYFASFQGNTKALEFAQNNTVAFTTISIETSEHVRATNATVQKSNLTIYDLKDAFVTKLPDYKMTIENFGDKLDVYEVHFKEASVILGFNQNGKVTF